MNNPKRLAEENYNRYRQLEMLEIPAAHMDVVEYLGTPLQRGYERRLQEKQLEARERWAEHLRNIESELIEVRK